MNKNARTETNIWTKFITTAIVGEDETKWDGLNLNNIQDLVMPLPPLAGQRWIVAKVEQRMAWVGALETQLTASRATAAKLLSALVAELT